MPKILWFQESMYSFADVDSTYDELIDIFREDRFYASSCL